MNKSLLILLFVFTLLFFQCKKATEKDVRIDLKNLKGLWCNDWFCANIQDSTARIASLTFLPMHIANGQIILTNQKNAEKTIYHITKLTADSLYMISNKSDRELKFKRIERLHPYNFSILEYSQVNDFSDFNMIINSNGNMELEVKYHPKIEDGYYTGTLKKVEIEFLNQLIKSVELKVPKQLNNKIISDIPEWAAIIKILNGEDYYIYYNYKNSSKQYQILSLYLNELPELVENLQLQKSSKWIKSAEIFRKAEFERNILQSKAAGF